MNDKDREELAALQSTVQKMLVAQQGVIETQAVILESIGLQTRASGEVNAALAAVMGQISTLRVLLSATAHTLVTDDETAAQAAKAIRSAMDNNAAQFMGDLSLAGPAVPSEALLLHMLPASVRQHLGSI